MSNHEITPDVTEFNYMAGAACVGKIDAAWEIIPFINRPVLGEIVLFKGTEYRIMSVRKI